jgi:hypothetical protein
MPNGHDEDRRRIRAASRFWYTVFVALVRRMLGKPILY